jgi:two-component sensor histidine kinase/CheY-like chemotaxis protein
MTMATKILIIDDEKCVTDVLKATLGYFGYDADTMNSGKEALTRIGESRPDLVLMDIQLNEGERDGISIAGEIRNTFRIPVVYITGFLEDCSLERAKETEPFGYLMKPFDKNELRAAVEIALHRAALESERRRADDIIKRKLELEKTVSLTSSRFIGSFKFEEAIRESLRDMGMLRKAYHAYLIQLDEHQSPKAPMYEWYEEGVPHGSNGLPREIFPSWVKKLRQGEIIHIRTSSRMPEGTEKESLKEHGILSLLVLPVQSGSSLVGFIGIESRVKKIEWNEDDVSIFKVASEVIGRALEHDSQQQELIKYRCHLEELVEERTGELKILNGKLEREIDERKASLREKEVMLKEIHHRVKNNLQVISSLLNLQARHIDDPHLLEIFCESQNRVRSMAIIHEKLCQSRDLAHVDFGDYLAKLIPFLFHSYGRRNVAYQIEAGAIFLSIDCAIPCGLIVNELVSNAIKHGFPEGSRGNILIHAESLDEYRISLTVSDDGIGFPKDLDFHSTTSLGLQLVKDLAIQIDGRLEVKNDRGAHFTLKFRTLTPHLSLESGATV